MITSASPMRRRAGAGARRVGHDRERTCAEGKPRAGQSQVVGIALSTPHTSTTTLASGIVADTAPASSDDSAVARLAVLDGGERVEQLLAGAGGQRSPLHAHVDTLRIAERTQTDASRRLRWRARSPRAVASSRRWNGTGRSRSAIGGSLRTAGPSWCPCARWNASARGAGRRRADIRAGRGTRRRRGERSEAGSPSRSRRIAERLSVEQHGARVHEQVDRLVAPVRSLEQAERVAAHDAHRADLDDAALLRRNGEELFGLLAGREPLDAELAAPRTDGQHDARGKDGPRSAVCERQRADGPLAHDDPGARRGRATRRTRCGR